MKSHQIAMWPAVVVVATAAAAAAAVVVAVAAGSGLHRCEDTPLAQGSPIPDWS